MAEREPPSGDPAINAQQLAQAERYVEQEEGATRLLSGRQGIALSALAIAVSLFHLYAAYGIVPAQVLRVVHVGCVLVLAFLLYPAGSGSALSRYWNWLLAALSLVVIGYILASGDAFVDRATFPDPPDLIIGVVLMILVLEGVRRTSGWIMPLVVALFLTYAMAGPHLPAPWTHKGYDIPRLVGHMVMTLEGIFGPAVDVSATLIILFTIYGAFLLQSGAGRFFIDFSFALMGGKRAAAGRAVVLSSFLLGGPSGSGVATTVTLGSVAWPILARAGYGRNAAGGLLAAGGLGAILSPPVLGAAAFLIAEFLKISYLDVLRMALVPTLLYYLSLFIMVELDARKLGGGATVGAPAQSLGMLTRQYGFHFLSLLSIVVFLLLGFSATLAVFWAIVLVYGLSFLRRDCALVPRKLAQALAAGTTGVVNVATTCAAAGLIVGVVTLTGLGLKFSAIVIDYAGNSLLLTTLYTGLIVWIVGLAVPVTASYIICAVVAAPALINLGVPDFAAHMFIFYYAVLSEVSPPTALSPFAAAAITGGNPYRTTLQSWKYTLPAFLVPLLFVLDPAGEGLLLKGSAAQVAVTSLSALIGIAALACGVQNWLLKKLHGLERLMLIAAGLLLAYPRELFDLLGCVLFALILVSQWLRRPRPLDHA